MSQLPPFAIGWVREKTDTRTSVLQWGDPGEKHAHCLNLKGQEKTCGALAALLCLAFSC